jgi:hypothetical protein
MGVLGKMLSVLVLHVFGEVLICSLYQRQDQCKILIKKNTIYCYLFSYTTVVWITNKRQEGFLKESFRLPG